HTPPEIDDGNHDTAMLHHALDPRRHVGHGVRRRVAQHAVHGEHVGREEIQAKLKRDELDDVRGIPLRLLHLRSPGAPAPPTPPNVPTAASSSVSGSSTAIKSRPCRTTPMSSLLDTSAPGTGRISVSSTTTV